MTVPLQRSFSELGTPLAGVTFCVIDLETTGSSHMDAITEIGAMRICRGEPAGTFHTLVQPGRAIPTSIRMLTGIGDSMLRDAPAIEAVLPSLLGFVSGTVLVAHNARFDVGFLDRALTANSYPKLDNVVVDTAALARKILAGEVADHRLSTLAAHFRCAHRPSHRAFEDVLATVDVLHHLIERVSGYGVTTLEELRSITASRLDGTFSKIRLTDSLPHKPGVYRFIGADNKTLYVGKATDIRTRVRSYFYGDPRKRIRNLLRETQDVKATTYSSMLEAEIAEARAIATEQPPYNRAGKRSRSWYVKVTAGRSPKLGAARVPKNDGNVYLGPFPSMRTIRALLDALRDAARVHRCNEPRRCANCPYSDLGTCAGPDGQREELRVIAAAIAGDAQPALRAVGERMTRLAASERFEEAAEVRERGALLESSLFRSMEAVAVRDAGDVVLAIGRRAVLIREGRLVCAIDLVPEAPPGAPGSERDAVRRVIAAAPEPLRSRFLTDAQQREARVLSSWLKRTSEDVRVLHAERAWALPISAAPSDRFSMRS